MKIDYDLSNINPEDVLDPVLFQVGMLGQEPHIKQIPILQSPAKYKVICCGRRAGKTQMIAGEIIRGACLSKYRRQMAIAPTYKQVLIIFDKIVNILVKCSLKKDLRHFVRSPHPKIEFMNNCEIHFGSADRPDTLRGEAFDRIFIDEASFIKTNAWNVIRPLTFDTGAPIWQTSTPFGRGRFYEDFQRGVRKDKEWESFHFTTLDNPYIHIEEVKKEIEEYGENSTYIKTEIFAEFIDDVDVYFPFELIKDCTEDYELFNSSEIYI